MRRIIRRIVTAATAVVLAGAGGTLLSDTAGADTPQTETQLWTSSSAATLAETSTSHQA